MRIFKTNWFARYSRREGIGDDGLRNAIERAERGQIDADLGGDLIKQRIAREGQGRSGGFRTVIVFRKGHRAFFVYGFAKNAIENIDRAQLNELKELAKDLLSFSEHAIERQVEIDELTEIPNDD